MSARKAVGWLAIAVLVAALVVGLIPHSVPGDQVYRTVSCGSVLQPSTDAQSTDLGAAMAGFSRDFESQCSSAMTVPQVATWVLIGVAVLALGFLALTRRRSAVVPVDEQQYRQQQDQADR